jgi:hypothetical protein
MRIVPSSKTRLSWCDDENLANAAFGTGLLAATFTLTVLSLKAGPFAEGDCVNRWSTTM